MAGKLSTKRDHPNGALLSLVLLVIALASLHGGLLRLLAQRAEQLRGTRRARRHEHGVRALRRARRVTRACGQRAASAHRKLALDRVVRHVFYNVRNVVIELERVLDAAQF